VNKIIEKSSIRTLMPSLETISSSFDGVVFALAQHTSLVNESVVKTAPVWRATQ
jgi:hypothetical protein